MQFETQPLENSDTAASDSWLARLIAFIAWLFSAANKLKRIRATTRFKPDWRDRYAELLPVEWHRHQMLAQGAALLLAGKTLNDADYQHIPMPADFGGPCPNTPFEIARRWLVITDFLKNPEAHILRHAARIARREGIILSSAPLRHAATRRATSPTCVASEGGKAPVVAGIASTSRHATGGGGSRVLHARDGGGLAFARARAPPTLSLFTTPQCLSAPAPENAPARPNPLVWPHRPRAAMIPA